MRRYTVTPATKRGHQGLAILASRQAETRRVWNLNGAPDPEIAVAVSTAWLLASTDEDAIKIKPYSRSATAVPPAEAESALAGVDPYSVHYASPIIHFHDDPKTSFEADPISSVASDLNLKPPIVSGTETFDPLTGELIPQDSESLTEYARRISNFKPPKPRIGDCSPFDLPHRELHTMHIGSRTHKASSPL
jgi:hypothetical protein